MLIYVNTENYRDWSNSADVVWDTIPVEVEVGFSAMGKYYDPDSKTWIDDVIPEPTKEEMLVEEIKDLKKKRSILIQEATILKDIDPEEYEILLEDVKDLTKNIKDKEREFEGSN